MADRRVKVNLDLDASGYEAGAKRAKGATDALGDSVDKTKQKNEQSQTSMQKLTGFVRENDQAMQTAGKSLVGLGIGLTGLAVGATKAAIDWESAWAGVQKTNDGTAEQMQKLEGDLRGLAKTLPATHTEIAAVAEAAGQLGVSVDDVADFTLTMINMGETTNLSAEEAATGIARFSNVMGTAWSDADRLGSTIVGLGNNFATTEAEILHMAQRIAPVGRVMNMTESDVLGMSAAMSSVGIEAEAGGTALNMVMKKIDAAVREGGSSLTSWAEAAGVSASEFAAAWERRPAEAMQILSAGLGETASAGGDVNAVLSELGVKGIRESSTMLSLASASGLLADSLELSGEAWAENSALAEEAEVRYATAEARMSMAWNNIKDVAITAGASIAPMVGDMADAVSDVASKFGELPAPVLGAVTALSGVVGVAALAGGGLLMLAPRAVETWDAFKRLKASTSGVPSVLRSVGKAAGYAAVGIAALSILRTVAENAVPAAKGIEEVTAALIALDNTGSGKDLNEIFQFGKMKDEAGEAIPVIDGLGDALRTIDIGGAGDAFGRAGEHIGSFNATVLKIPNDIKRMNEQFEQLDQALTGMDTETAAKHMRNLRDEAEAAGRQDFSSWSELSRVLPEYAASIQDMANATGESYSETEMLEMAMGKLPPIMQQAKEAADQAAQQDGLTSALEEVGVAADGTVDSLSEYLDMLFATGLAEQSAMQAQASYQESLEGVGSAVEQIKAEHGGLSEVLNDSKNGFDVTTEAGRLAQASFIDVASSGMDMAQAMAEAGESQETIQEGLQGTYDDLISTAGEFGITGTAAEELARSVLGVPEGVDIETWMDETAQTTANELGSSLDAIPEGLTVITEMDDAARAKAFETGAAVDAITGYRKVDVAISEDGTAGQVQSKVNSITGKTEYVFVTDDGTTTTVQQQIVNIDGVNRTVYVGDNGTIYATQSEINGISDGSSTVHVIGSGIASVDRLINNAARDRTSTITVTQRVHKIQTSGPSQNRPSYGLSRPGGYAGGRVGRDFGLPGLAGGGRLPYTGLGTDKILGVNAEGMPLALVDDLEWVVNRRSSDKYDGVISRINADHPSVQHLAHLRDGGRAGQLASTAMAMAPNVSVTAPPVDTAAIGAAVAGALPAALQGVQVVTNIAGRPFYGAIRDVTNQYGRL